MNNSIFAIGAIALASLAGGVQAAQVTVSGGITIGATGTTGPLAADSTTAITFSGSSADASVTGLVAATSTIVGSQQTLNLRLTGFTFTSTSQSNVVIEVNIIQDYVLTNQGSFSTASHQLNGNTQGTRSGNIVVTSVHESTNLPVLNVGFVGATNPITAEQGATTVVSPIDGIYRINTTYRFTIEGGSGTGSIILPDSGHDDVLLVLVPLPPAAAAGLGGLALVGVGASLRRRALHR
ncbi:MAG: hypothetical protein U0637_04775 [Phycisphaerales bacterium]